jgi:hypothetical protein
MYLQETEWECVDWTCEKSCEHTNEPMGSIKCRIWLPQELSAAEVFYSWEMETELALVQIIRTRVGSNYRSDGCHMSSTL